MAAALFVLGASWAGAMTSWPAGSLHTGTIALALCLVSAVVVAYRFPIYIRHNTKLCVFTVPLYLMAIFLDPPLAATAAGLGVLSGELVVRAQHGSLPCDIATHIGRWGVVMLVGSRVAHAGVPAAADLPHAVLLAATAVILFTGDLLTAPLALAPLCDESVDRLIRTLVREGGLVEGAQYGVGLALALAMQHQIWTFPLFGLPVVVVYLLSRREIDPETYQLLESMADAVDLRDPYTVDHSRRVVEVTRAILEELGRNGQEAVLILAAARVHDVGKMEVPDHILLKQGVLTEGERALLETHAQRGGELLQRYPDFARTVEMVRHHHERWDGRGYPDRLQRTEIPFGARIIAVAESFDAMTTDRVYRRALPVQRAAEILLDGRGRQWDPAIVDALVARLGNDVRQRQASGPGLRAPEGQEVIGSVVTA